MSLSENWPKTLSLLGICCGPVLDLVKERDRRTRKLSTNQPLPSRLTVLQRIKSLLVCCEDGEQKETNAVGSIEVDEQLSKHDFEEENQSLLDSKDTTGQEERFDSRIDSCSLIIAISEC